MERAWEILTREASEAAQWLGTEIDPVFSSPLPALGNGSVTGKTRGEIVAAIEKTRAQLLSKALALYLPRKARPAWAWKQRDKISSSWLLALPGADSSLSNADDGLPDRPGQVRARWVRCPHRHGAEGAASGEGGGSWEGEEEKNRKVMKIMQIMPIIQI